MILGRVVGPVVATAKHKDLHAQKLLRVQPEEPDGSPSGDEILAADAVGAGPGERVLVVTEGRSAGEAIRVPQGAVDAAVIAIVDRVDLDG